MYYIDSKGYKLESKSNGNYLTNQTNSKIMPLVIYDLAWGGHTHTNAHTHTYMHESDLKTLGLIIISIL